MIDSGDCSDLVDFIVSYKAHFHFDSSDPVYKKLVTIASEHGLSLKSAPSRTPKRSYEREVYADATNRSNRSSRRSEARDTISPLSMSSGAKVPQKNYDAASRVQLMIYPMAIYQ